MTAGWNDPRNKAVYSEKPIDDSMRLRRNKKKPAQIIPEGMNQGFVPAPQPAPSAPMGMVGAPMGGPPPMGGAMGMPQPAMGGAPMQQMGQVPPMGAPPMGGGAPTPQAGFNPLQQQQPPQQQQPVEAAAPDSGAAKG